jgi:hypothetical protein
VDEKRMLSQLEELAQGLDIKIRYEVLRKEGSFSPGGLCRFKGEWLLILNSKASNQEKLETMAGAVNRFDLSRVYLKPGLREFLEKFPRQEELLKYE